MSSSTTIGSHSIYLSAISEQFCKVNKDNKVDTSLFTTAEMRKINNLHTR